MGTKIGQKIIVCSLVFYFVFVLFPERVLSAQTLPPSLKGIIGEMTAQPMFVELAGQGEVLLLPTKAGLYLVKDGQIQKHFCPGQEVMALAVLPDLDRDGQKDLVVGLKEELLPNVLALSSEKGTIIWRFSPVNKIYKEGYGRLDYQPEITGIICFPDSNEQVLYLSAGYSLYKLSVFNGGVLWEHREPGKIIAISTDADLSGKSPGYITLFNVRGEDVTIDSQAGKEIKRQPAGQFQNMAKNVWITDSKGRVLRTDLPSEVALLDKELTTKVWSLPKFQTNGYLGLSDGSNDLILLYAMGQDAGIKKQGLIQKVTNQGELIWEYGLESSFLADYQGMELIQIGGDFNQDGVSDILGALSPAASAESGLPAKVIAISGHSGEIIWEGNLIHPTKISALIPYQDINNDGVPEVFVGTISNAYLLDGAEGKIIRDWIYFNSQKDGYFEPTKGLEQEVLLIPAGDVNKDNLTDLFVLSSLEVRLGLSNRVEGLDFYYKELTVASQGEFNLEESFSFDDLNMDGIPELLLTQEIGEQKVKMIISGADGELMVEIKGSKPILKSTGVDFNNNQVLDILSYQVNPDRVVTLQLIDGLDGKTIWTSPGFPAEEGLNFAEMSPSCFVDDLNGDGMPELAILKAAVSGRGLFIDIYDVAGGWAEPYKTLQIQAGAYPKVNRSWVWGFNLETVGLYAEKYLAVTGRLDGSDVGLNLLLYDYKEEKVLGFYPVSARAIAVRGDSLVIEDLEKKVSFWHLPVGQGEIELIGDSNRSPLRFKLRSGDTFARTKIYIDNILALETLADTAELEITSGKHLLGIAQYDLLGEHTYQNIPVEIAAGNVGRNITTVLTIVLLGLVFGVPAYLRQRIRAGVKRG
ncbi:MAG TPA: PQQ-binding-like beta-propeller repeat protein [Peptococcaceae bacterium]|nr:PQQ-binding-like beta-propeller repeat protein [Peptococcaceae bacterium]